VTVAAAASLECLTCLLPKALQETSLELNVVDLGYFLESRWAKRRLSGADSSDPWEELQENRPKSLVH
jgi:hypothetical protein